MPEMRSVLNAPLTRNIVRGLIIVARDQPDLWRALTHEFGQSQEIRVLLDRRQGERRKDNQAHGTAAAQAEVQARFRARVPDLPRDGWRQMLNAW